MNSRSQFLSFDSLITNLTASRIFSSLIDDFSGVSKMTKGANWGFLFFDHFFRGWPVLVRSVDFEDMPGFVSKLKRLRITISFFSK